MYCSVEEHDRNYKLPVVTQVLKHSLRMSVHMNEWYAVNLCSLVFQGAYLCDLLHVLFCVRIQVTLFPGETGTAGPGQQSTGSFGESTSHPL